MGILRELKSLKGTVDENKSLKPYTTFKVGGLARYFYIAKEEGDFIESVSIAKKHNLPYFILAGGSNILISDDGFSGIVIKREIKNFIKEIEVKENKIVCDAAISLGFIVSFAARNNLSGLEWAIGIPGTVGGAIRGNAGAYGGQMSDVVESVKFICDFNNKKIEIKNNKRVNFSYRSSIFKKSYTKCIILSTEIKLNEGNKDDIANKMKDILKKRKSSSMLQHPCAGCIFKNPKVNDKLLISQFEKDKRVKIKGSQIPAGYLIDELGLKGKRIGGAEISDKNANFIINTEKASAADVVMLISYIKQQVRDHFGVQLEEEIELIGF